MCDAEDASCPSTPPTIPAHLQWCFLCKVWRHSRHQQLAAHPTHAQLLHSTHQFYETDKRHCLFGELMTGSLNKDSNTKHNSPRKDRPISTDKISSHLQWCFLCKVWRHSGHQQLAAHPTHAQLPRQPGSSTLQQAVVVHILPAWALAAARYTTLHALHIKEREPHSRAATAGKKWISPAVVFPLRSVAPQWTPAACAPPHTCPACLPACPRRSPWDTPCSLTAPAVQCAVRCSAAWFCFGNHGGALCSSRAE
jgi:hypothetical protein